MSFNFHWHWHITTIGTEGTGIRLIVETLRTKEKSKQIFYWLNAIPLLNAYNCPPRLSTLPSTETPLLLQRGPVLPYMNSIYPSIDLLFQTQ